MQANRLQDLINRANGRAAFAVGNLCDVYRSSGATDPLAAGNRFMLLQAAFASPRAQNDRPVGYGQATWWGVFDSAYTRPGDYLVRKPSGSGAADRGVWFIAAQQPLLPVLCVSAPRLVTFVRPATTTAPGVSAYGGFVRAAANVLLTNFPASMLNHDVIGLDPTELPSDVAPESWEVLLPAIPTVVLRTGDLLTDDLARNGVVSAAELTELGWRLLVKQTTT